MGMAHRRSNASRHAVHMKLDEGVSGYRTHRPKLTSTYVYVLIFQREMLFVDTEGAFSSPRATFLYWQMAGTTGIPILDTKR